VAQERVAMVVIAADIADEAARAATPLPLPPPYLAGRYPGAVLWRVEPDDARLLDVGTLIHTNADITDPLAAIGVVVRIVDGAAIALVTGSAGQAASVREPGRAVGIRLVEPYRA
jgi:sarcosine oxidase subunit alpha